MTELAVIEPELVDTPAPEVVNTPTPLTEGMARNLDKRIRQAGGRVGVETDKLLELLKEAMDGQIHVALGKPSWLAYFKEVVGTLAWKGRDQRQALAGVLAGTGVSNRSSAAILGVDEATVRNDLRDADVSAPDKKKGADGKEYPAKPKPKDDNIIEAEWEEESEEEQRKPADVVEDFAAEVDTLLINVQAIKDILDVDAELFDKARKRCAQRFAKRLQGVVTDVQAVVDELMEG